MARLLTPRRHDNGSALVMAAIVAVVVFALGAGLLAFAAHQSTASNNDRQRQQAVDAAIAGLVFADSALTRDGAFLGSGKQPFASGSAEFEVTVELDSTAGATFRRIITAHGYAPSKEATSKSTRTMQQVVELSPVGFTYGVFSETAFETGSKSTMKGDIYANGNITLGNGNTNFIGNIYTKGTLSTGSNTDITGSIYADLNVDVSRTVTGNVYAGGFIKAGRISDNAQAGGTITCGIVHGTCTPNSKPPLVPLQHLPVFDGDKLTYSKPPMSWTEFKNLSPAHGTFKVNGDVAFNNNQGLSLDGDLTIVATGNISLPKSVSNATGAKVQLSIIASNGGTITPSNNFTIDATVRTMFYTKGQFVAKNSSTFWGTLYAGSLDNGANLEITYDPTASIGFDWSQANPQSFTIRHVSTRETTGG